MPQGCYTSCLPAASSVFLQIATKPALLPLARLDRWIANRHAGFSNPQLDKQGRGLYSYWHPISFLLTRQKDSALTLRLKEFLPLSIFSRRGLHTYSFFMLLSIFALSLLAFFLSPPRLQYLNSSGMRLKPAYLSSGLARYFSKARYSEGSQSQSMPVKIRHSVSSFFRFNFFYSRKQKLIFSISNNFQGGGCT